MMLLVPLALVALTGVAWGASPELPPAQVPPRPAQGLPPQAPVVPQAAPHALPPSMVSSSGENGGIVVPPDALLRMRDPFKRPETEAKNAARGPLESYGLDAFRMVGVMTGPRVRALVIASDGKSYVVRAGMKIGQKGGTILKITPEKIVVRERVANVLGQTENLDSEIALQPDKKTSLSGGPIKR